jgi:hypothetical protein
MKTFSAIVAAVSLLLIVLTSPPHSHPRGTGSTASAPAYWVNPDGSRGLLTQTGDAPASPRRQYSWINPDGIAGMESGSSGRSPAMHYSWMNPDGAAGKAGTVHAQADAGLRAF